MSLSCVHLVASNVAEYPQDDSSYDGWPLVVNATAQDGPCIISTDEKMGHAFLFPFSSFTVLLVCPQTQSLVSVSVSDGLQ